MKLTQDDLLNLQKFLQEEITWVQDQLTLNYCKSIQQDFEHKHSCLDQLRILVDHFLKKTL